MRVLVINLDRSPARLYTTMEELSRVGLSGERVVAVDGDTLTLDASGNVPGFKKRTGKNQKYYTGTAACWMSHMRALEEAISGNVWPCMIVEDDIVIMGSAPVTVPDVSEDIVYLGGLDHPTKGVYGCHAIVYKTRRAAERALMYQMSHPAAADYNMIRLNRLSPIHYARPYRIYQRNGISQISGSYIRRFPAKILLTFE